MLLIKRSLIVIISLFCAAFSVLGQPVKDYPYDIEYRDFIHYDKNRIIFPGDSSTFSGLYQKLDRLIMRGEGQIRIVHIGGSHIQAGALPGHFAVRLQTMYPGLKGSRGFVFPYNLANTNNPRNYYVRHTGVWQACRSVERNKLCTLGLSGISATTYDSAATLNVYLQRDAYLNYEFNLVKILHDTDPGCFSIRLDNCPGAVLLETNRDLGYSLFRLPRMTDSLELSFAKTDTAQRYFTLHGIVLETDEPGITYNGIGVNGASIPCYLRCTMLRQHLKAISPDWLILTLGTNDAYTRSFDPEFFYSNYDMLLGWIREAAPDAAILLTVPNDSYLYRRYVNYGTAKAGDVIKRIAEKHGCGYWDFYSIMGGLNSVTLWYKAGLTAKDKVHFSRHGYFIQADLLFNAFLKTYDTYLEENSF